MPTYKDLQGRRIQTGLAISHFSDEQKWLGIRAFKPDDTRGVVPYVSRTQINPEYGYEHNYLSEDEVIQAMGYKKTDLIFIHELPQTIHALTFVEVPAQKAG